ncbi:hypothetical protein [Yoonia maritima]|uniref:hypothetical protein n=1 Tax=Yoonia maritima TaxID=1435347 RepID=UPI001EF7F510|nr:hypothetical protein [Yoonia maritima]
MFHLKRMNDLTTPIAPSAGSPTPETPAKPIFLLQESDFLIAEDIEGALQSLGPCRVIRVRHISEVVSNLASEKNVSAAFLECGYDDVIEMNLHKILNELGAHIILTAGAADEHKVRSMGWGMLIRPFTEQLIHKELKAIAG